MAEIFIHHYRLIFHETANALSKQHGVDGVLIHYKQGYACIQPWQELGDPTLAQCLKDLATTKRLSLVRRALRCAELDGIAREKEYSLFEELEVPESHATLTSLNEEVLIDAVQKGFRYVKLKCGKNGSAETTWIQRQMAQFPQIRWRFDFNESLHPPEFQKWMSEINPDYRNRIDFIEDPTPYSTTAWQKLHQLYKIDLAVDRESSPQSDAAQVMVIKPAIDEPLLLAEAALMKRQRLCMTSYMDHPLGQAFAAWEAGRLNLMFPGCLKVCGLQTHHLFKPNAFSEVLGEWKPDFQNPEGFGLGFNEQLAALSWMPLT